MNRFLDYLRITALFIATVFLAGCASNIVSVKTTRARLGYTTAIHKELISLPAPREPIVVAVYKFRDQTGQYKSSAAGMTWSTAVSQGATSMLLKALEDSKWFLTLEREGLSNLLNERRIIRQTREQYMDSDGRSIPSLPPLMYAGVTLEGGIISYETNRVTGGFGAKYFGLGGSTQFRRDQVTIYLRAVSTSNGRILKTVYTTKSILSRMIDVGLYRYVRVKRLLEIESGFSINEPVHMCVLEAIEKAVHSLIVEGIIDQLWELKNPEEIKSALIQNYLKEKDNTEQYVQFDKKGNIVTASSSYNASNVVRKRLGVGLNVAAQYYVGDYRRPWLRPAGDIFIRYGATSWLSFMLNCGGGYIANRDNFKTLMANVDLRILFTLLPRSRLTPFFFVGGSAINFWVEDRDGFKIERERTSNNYWGWEPAVVSGIGLEYFINRNWSLRLIADNYFTFTDQLDGIVHGKRDDAYWGGRVGLTYYLGH